MQARLEIMDLILQNLYVILVGHQALSRWEIESWRRVSGEEEEEREREERGRRGSYLLIYDCIMIQMFADKGSELAGGGAVGHGRKHRRIARWPIRCRKSFICVESYVPLCVRSRVCSLGSAVQVFF